MPRVSWFGEIVVGSINVLYLNTNFLRELTLKSIVMVALWFWIFFPMIDWVMFFLRRNYHFADFGVETWEFLVTTAKDVNESPLKHSKCEIGKTTTFSDGLSNLVKRQTMWHITKVSPYHQCENLWWKDRVLVLWSLTS